MLKNSLHQRFLSIPCACFLALGMQGCGNKVDCNDSQIKKDAIDIIKSHLVDWDKSINLATSGDAVLAGVRTLSKDDELKQAQCVAKYTFTYNKKEHGVDVPYYVSYLQDKKAVEVKVAIDDLKQGIMRMALDEPPIKNGIEKVINKETGKIQSTIEWKDGAKVAAKTWSDDGSVVISDINWIDGKANGFEKRSENGKFVTDLIWKEGKQTGVLSTLDEETHFKDGKYDGAHVRYGFSSAGRYVNLTESYKDGKLNGIQRQYSSDGTVEQEATYENGEKISEKTFSYDETHPVEACVSKKVEDFMKTGINVVPTGEQRQKWTAECSAKAS